MVHGPLARAELFEDMIRAEGHELDEWSLIDEPAPPRDVGDYDAVLIFGGHMNVHEEQKHPWLREEDDVIRHIVAREVPLLGVCLGGQLLAKASGAAVGRSPEPERGFTRVTLSDDAANDPVFGALPREFDVFNLHGDAFETPATGVELARSRVCTQAIRVGAAAWGVQFHPEVRISQVEAWFETEERVADGPRVLGELRTRIDEWQAFGAGLCGAFLAEASRRASSKPVPGTVPTL